MAKGGANCLVLWKGGYFCLLRAADRYAELLLCLSILEHLWWVVAELQSSLWWASSSLCTPRKSWGGSEQGTLSSCTLKGISTSSRKYILKLKTKHNWLHSRNSSGQSKAITDWREKEIQSFLNHHTIISKNKHLQVLAAWSLRLTGEGRFL